jgi:hypothetical protein
MEQPASHAGSNPGPRPLSVRYARGLLWVQAGLWAVATLGTGVLWITSMAMNWAPVARTHSRLDWFIAAGICFILAGVLSAGSAILATSLARGSAEARIAVVVLESFMVLFGWLFATYTATGEGFVDPGPPAGLVGGALSLAAAVGLLSKHARRFTRRGQTAAPTG